MSDITKLSQAAKDEIGETRADIKIVREEVKEVIAAKYGDLLLPPDADKLIDRCLRCRKFNIHSAAKLVHSFFKLLADVRNMHSEPWYFVPSAQGKAFYESQGIVLLKNRDCQGRAVVLIDYGKMPFETFSADKSFAALILMLNEVTRTSVDVQRLGVVCVFNMEGFQFGHAKYFGVSRVRAMARLTMGAFPARIKGMHAIKSSAVVCGLYALFRHLLGEKMKNRIHMYGHDLDKFYKHVSPDLLPEYLGGNLSNNCYTDEEFSMKLSTQDNYYAEFLQYGYMKRGSAHDS